MTTEPHVSVIVPAYNAAATIKDQLEALARQRTDLPYEVLVVDNRSTDATADIVTRCAAAWPVIRLLTAPDVAGSAHARNVGARAALAPRLAFCDADDLVDPGWLDALMVRLANDRIVYGTLKVDEINAADVRAWRSTPHAAEPGRGDFAPSSNMAIATRTYLDLGGMDEEYPKAHDVEFSYRAREAGVELVAAPDAIVHYRYRAELLEVFRQSFRSGRAAVQLLTRFPATSPRRSARAVGADYWWLLSRSPLLLWRKRRGLWVAALGMRLGRIYGSIRYGVVHP